LETTGDINLSSVNSIGIIGSFRKHYDQVLQAWKIFYDSGLEIYSPKGSRIIDESKEFVRFESDDPEDSDCMVQSRTLARLFLADIVYVISPKGYIGKTTSYEVGRLIQICKPLYFSSHPIDLPICIPSEHIITPRELVSFLRNQSWNPKPLFFARKNPLDNIESSLQNFSSKI
jgi:hypothetical protein